MVRTAASGARKLRRRRSIWLVTALAAALVALLVAINPFVSATSGGDPYSVPLVNDTNPAANIVETTITAEEATVDIGNGVQAHAQTFNGQIPGPTFKLNVGDTVIVHYHNKLQRISGIHWHGIELANDMDGTPFTQNQVAPGGTFLYKFTVHRPGLFWYHPHHHSSTNQVFKGLYGMIVVSDPNETALQKSGILPSEGQTRQIVLSDTTVCKQKGSNDDPTYSETLPHVSGAVLLPKQNEPTAKNLCEGPAVGANPYPVDEDGKVRGPYESGDIPSIQTFLHKGRTNEGQTVLTNGRNVGGRSGSPCLPAGCPPNTKPGSLASGASTLNVQPGQGLRLQLLNAATVRYFRLQLTDKDGKKIPLIRVGGEGGLLNKAVEEGGEEGTWKTGYLDGEILLPPGGRADVVAAIPKTATGVLTLWTEDYERTGENYSNIPTVPVMHLNVSGAAVNPAYEIENEDPLRAATGNPVETLGPATGILLNPATFSPKKPGKALPTITLTSDAGKELGVDEIFGDHDGAANYMEAKHLESSRYAEEGDIIQLEVTNTTGANHPFHLHGFSIQPISLTNGGEKFEWFKAGKERPEFRDNVDVPGGFTLKFRVRLDSRPMPDGTTEGGALGRWLFHCHIFFHATNGMLSEVVVTGPGGNERPDISFDNSEPAVTQGSTATVTGTYKDPDGDPVKLSASVGTVADSGGGKFTWTYPTKSTETSSVVYVTAVDSHNLAGQDALYLNVATHGLPVITHLKVVPKKFTPGKGKTALKRAAASKKKKKGAKIRFSLSEAAKVQFEIKRLKPKRPKVKAPKFSRNIKKAGKRAIAFSGRFKKTGALPPGKYRLTARATDSAGRKSKRVSTTFKIAR